MRMISTNEPTRYEIEARAADGRAFLVCYSSGSPSRRRLVGAIRSRAPDIIAKLGVPEEATFTLATKPRPAAKVGDWTIKYSGRTQRDIRSCGGELPFIGG